MSEDKEAGDVVIRQPIVTVAGHVDHGKTSILDQFRGSSVQEGEAGGITQKISFTRYPLDKIKSTCPLIEKQGVELDIPGFLFIDTPGHAAFTNLRKRGGSLADLAVLVVNINEGIKPQTAEVLKILKTYKTPFVVALNKVDMISGWQDKGGVKKSVDGQAIRVANDFQEKLLTFQGALQEYGFESSLFYEVGDFSKEIALVPCSAKTGEGIPELLFVLCGLCQRFLKERLKLKEEAKGVVLEVKKSPRGGVVESILYDGYLSEGDEIAIAGFDGVVQSKIRSLEENEPLSYKYSRVDKARASTGLRLNLKEKEGIVSGMPFQKVSGNIDTIEESFKKEVSGAVKTDNAGIIAKADSLGSLEALLVLLRQANIQVVKAGIGPINKSDIISAQTNLENDPMNAVVVGFNVDLEEDIGLDLGNVKVFSDEVVYKLIEDIDKWRADKAAEIERGRLMQLAPVFKLEVLKEYVFRNTNPAIFGVRVAGGKAKVGSELIDEYGEVVGRIKGMQLDKESVSEAGEGSELAVSIPGINFERRMKDVESLYSNISEKQFKKFRENKDLLSASEMKVLHELSLMKEE